MKRQFISLLLFFFFFTDTATTEIYTLSLHDALPTSRRWWPTSTGRRTSGSRCSPWSRDRKSTRLNSSHVAISYAAFCLKNKKHRRARHRASRQHVGGQVGDGEARQR